MPDVNLNSIRSRFGLKGGDLTIMLLSLVLAVSVWLVSNLSREYSSVMTVPVDALSNVEGHARAATDPVEIMARVRTTGFHLLNNRRGGSAPVTVFFKPSDLHRDDSDNDFYITANELSGYTEQIFGEGVSLEGFVTSRAVFTFPVENNKKVPVQPLQSISYSPQYMAAGPLTLQPDSVTVYGEPMHLENVDRVFTSAITLSALRRNAQGVVKLECPRGVRLSDEEAAYSLEVTRYVEVRSTVKIGVRNAPPGKDLTVFPSTAEVVYRCAFPLRVNPAEGVNFAVDYRDFASSINGRCVPRPSRLPAGVLDYMIDPEVMECIDSSTR